ncbi:uncharacterized protein Z518_11154 [Rhinocladiella mackenziei CBS 650.93]|uniref:Transcription factor domain-containing protein n=1 Tax=Rhinocladiella mackenziei CBS 650.93 TaxID=1442369 RepID=A0A0D2FCA9_9EURO|nr:uncharacterized protein Z518_11154 [Rhinocladiella mackenziei CBS 650.93]KIW99741.1 hypothetical protein Z518_11154 [Rhinocladiella mackenziei CBS 650.93]
MTLVIHVAAEVRNASTTKGALSVVDVGKCKHEDRCHLRDVPFTKRRHSEALEADLPYAERLVNFYSAPVSGLRRAPANCSKPSADLSEASEAFDVIPGPGGQVLFPEHFDEQIHDILEPGDTRLASATSLPQENSLSYPETMNYWQTPEGDFAFVAGYERPASGHENVSDNFPFVLNDRLSPTSELLSPTEGMTSSSGSWGGSEIWDSVQQFFDTMYFVLPVLSYQRLLSRLITEPIWTSNPDFRTLLLSIRMLNTASEFRMGLKQSTPLFDLIHQVERSRLCYEFAEPPTLDAAVVSLFLFTAYNVLEKHTRAFMYLDEAFSLLDAVELVGEEEERRKRQIEQVLFNTEAASLAIYGGKRMKRRARRPLMILDERPTVSDKTEHNAEIDRVATDLLRRLTQIHLADDADALQMTDIESEADIRALFGAVFQRHRYSRIQAADVVITRQWQLSSKLAGSLRNGMSGPKLNETQVEQLGMAAMAWICLLEEGELRIVGLGKLSALVQNIFTLVGHGKCRYVLGGLVGAVLKEDYERNFAHALVHVSMSLAPTGPSPIPPLWDNENGDRDSRVCATVPAEDGDSQSAKILHAFTTTGESSTREEIPPTIGLMEEEQLEDLNPGNIDWLLDLS